MLLRSLILIIPLAPFIIYYTVSERADQWFSRKSGYSDLPSDSFSRILVTMMIVMLTILIPSTLALIYTVFRWIVTGN